MADEGFLKRWSRLKATPEEARAEPALPEAASVAGGAGPADPVRSGSGSLPGAAGPAPRGPTPSSGTPPPPPPPTIADAAALTHDSDFSTFVAKNVDAAVRRLAMKKLFSDPHFQGHDGLDIYMGDYTIPSPVSADMLADMIHNKNIFARLDDVVEQVDAMLAAPAAGNVIAVPAGDDAIAAQDPIPGTPETPAAAPSPQSAAPDQEVA